MEPFQIIVQFFKLLLFDALVAAAFFALLIPLKRFKCASFAVLKRDFVGYFSSPTGYVFICVFMSLSTIAAFWPDEFFNANLATLDQLNKWFPLIMLVFIPAITMSIWSEERREGTDELLLTIPATDVDIVLGKFLAAVAIFTVALLFSQLWNFKVLLELSLGDVDLGLFIATYTGYWFMGVAMLSLGMAASFLTSNLTVSFILGALFNAPLVGLLFVDNIVSGRGIAQSLSWWSYLSRFSDFGRGVISVASTSFFVLVVAVGVYLSIILIGRRHWQGGRDGQSLLGHYLIRGVALIAFALAASKFISYHDWFRYDATTEKVSSLSPDTKRLLRNLDTKHTVLAEAFVSSSVPEQYVQTKVDLINMLREFGSLAGANIQIRVHDKVDPYTEEATRAEEQYGITAQTVMTQARGAIKQEELFLGAAFSCGLERVVIPFFDRGIPVEYELVRSITTVADATRRKIGVVKTDAEMFGGFDMATFRPRRKQLIIEELEKQYDVEEVDPANPIEEGIYDVLLVVQPSSLTPPAMENLVSAIQNGQPAAIFEDPFPAMMEGAPATSQPREAPGGMGGMFGGQRPPEPKGDIRRLWSVLGIDMVGEEPPGGTGPFDAKVVWQKFNPYQNKVNVFNITPEWVFISPDAPGVGDDAFNPQDVVSSGLSQLLFLFPGAIRDLGTRKLDFVPLTMTGDESGEIDFMDLRQNQNNPLALEYLRKFTKKRYIIGARIQGKVGSQFQMSDAGSPLLAQAGPAPAGTEVAADVEAEAGDAEKSAPLEKKDSVASEEQETSREQELHVIYICDIDLLSSEFLAIRAQPDDEIKWEFDNVTFVLNILDSLAGDEELIEIRKRRLRHGTLKLVSKQTEEARGEALAEIGTFKEDFENARAEAQQRMDDAVEKRRQEVEELRLKAQTDGAVRSELMAAMQRLEIEQRQLQAEFQRDIDRREQERDRKLKLIDRELELGIRKVQTREKVNAVIYPPIPPLLIGLLVWLFRRNREKEGIIAARRR